MANEHALSFEVNSTAESMTVTGFWVGVVQLGGVLIDPTRVNSESYPTTSTASTLGYENLNDGTHVAQSQFPVSHRFQETRPGYLVFTARSRIQ
jgi:hypothetical protein